VDEKPVCYGPFSGGSIQHAISAKKRVIAVDDGMVLDCSLEHGGTPMGGDELFPEYGVRVFLVEDNAEHSFIAVTVLRQLLGESSETVVAQTADEAVDLIAQFTEHDRPDLILVDLRLPGSGGFAVLSAVRSHEACAKVPVFVITSSLYDQDIAQSYELGASAVLCKPLSRASLREELVRIGKLPPRDSSKRTDDSN
jgi:CheY-like chemotaxis protein